jgi:eukaryotic-like serine/threonine-protein kinase
MSAPWPEELPRGFEFDQYTVLDCVWHGSVASVYRAQVGAKGEVVALKVFERPRPEKRPYRRNVARGTRIGASVRHPNLAAVLGVGVWQERAYVVTEWLDGCDLEDYLSRWGLMSEDEVAELGLHLISGLMALHAAGTSHGDIKPSSIFLCNGHEGDVIPKLLLSDLPHLNGLATPVDTTTRELSLATPAYMPPEAVRGRTGGSAADQYSVSAVLYECATGQPPFVGETLLDLLRSIASGSITPLRSLRPELSSGLEAVVMQGLRADPEARFENLREMGRALWPLVSERASGPWAAAFGGGPPRSAPRRSMAVPGRPLPAPRSSPAAGRRSRLVVLLAATLAALTIGVAAFYLYSARSGAGSREHPAEPGHSSSANEPEPARESCLMAPRSLRA